MTNSKVHVWYDRRGKILAVGRPLSPETEQVIPIAFQKGHAAATLEVSEHHLRALHLTHSVEIKNKQAVLRERKKSNRKTST